MPLGFSSMLVAISITYTVGFRKNKQWDSEKIWISIYEL